MSPRSTSPRVQSQTKPSVSIVICSHDRPAFLQESLTRIREVGPDAQIVVVDSASPASVISKAAKAVISSWGELAADTLIVRADQRGLSIARNTGVAASSGEVIAFTDDDCLITDGWVPSLQATFAAPGVGAATGRVVPDADSRFVTSVDVREESFDYDTTNDPSTLGHGANLAFRRTALEAVGIFDPLLGAGARFRAAEDTDMLWRVLREGWSGRFDADSVVTHRQWRSTAQAIRMAYGYGLGAGAFAAKARRIDPETLWPQPPAERSRTAVRTSMRHLRHGYQSGTLAELETAAGVVSGYRQARTLPLDGPVFASR